MSQPSEGAMRTAAVVRAMCRRVAPENTSEDDIDRLYAYAIRLLGSRLSHTEPANLTTLSEQIQRKLARSGEAATAASVATLIAIVEKTPLLQKAWAIVALLKNLSTRLEPVGRQEAPTIPIPSFLRHRAGDKVVSTQGAIATALSGSSGLNAPEAAAELDPTQAARWRAVSAKLAKTPNYRFEISEAALLRDVVLAFQGVTGRHVLYDANLDGYAISPSVGVPPPTRSLVCKLTELGWLYSQLRQYCITCQADLSYGLTGQAFCAALQDEMAEYGRLISLLESQLPSDDNPQQTPLSLRRLVVWTHEPLHRLTNLVSLIDACSGLIGGQLLSMIAKFCSHGDSGVAALMKRVLSRAINPMYSVLHTWIFDGHLHDRYREFFIGVDASAMEREEQHWMEKYFLKEAMVPDFFPPGLAKRILDVGKTVDFLRRICHVHEPFMDHLARARPLVDLPMQSAFDPSKADALVATTTAAFQTASKTLLSILFDQHKLFHHFKAMRHYLLLGQGDFFRHLMDLLKDELERPASQLFLHNLTGVLETAIRATNAQFEDKNVLERLDVKLLVASPGDCGWDVFSLAYHVDGPLSVVFSGNSMMKYLTIFNFLWRAKRVEHTMSALWSDQMTNSRLLSNVGGMTEASHACRILAAEMIHFVNQIQYFLLFEVLESAWVELTSTLEQVMSFDQILVAHDNFLRLIMQRMFLMPESQAILSQLRSIFDLIAQFKMIQDELHMLGLGELERERKARAGRSARTAAGTWAADNESSALHGRAFVAFKRSVDDVMGKLHVVSRSFEVMLGRLLTMLAQSGDENLKFLATRIDFNELYASRIPAYAEASRTPRRAPRPRVARPVQGPGGQ